MNETTNEIRANKALMTVSDVAARLKVSTSQVYAMITNGKMRCYRLTTKTQGGIRVSEEQLEDFLRSAEVNREPLSSEPALRHIR
jgi:excisionase family DNA binding protein